MIQALVIFFVGADLLIVYIWRLRRHLHLRRPPPSEEPAPLVIDRFLNSVVRT